MSSYELEDLFGNVGGARRTEDMKYSTMPISASYGHEQAVDQRQNLRRSVLERATSSRQLVGTRAVAHKCRTNSENIDYLLGPSSKTS